MLGDPFLPHPTSAFLFSQEAVLLGPLPAAQLDCSMQGHASQPGALTPAGSGPKVWSVESLLLGGGGIWCSRAGDPPFCQGEGAGFPVASSTRCQT